MTCNEFTFDNYFEQPHCEDDQRQWWQLQEEQYSECEYDGASRGNQDE